MNIKKIVTRRSEGDEGDVLSAIWHWMLFIALKRFSGRIEIGFCRGSVTDLKEDGVSIGVDVKEINRRIRLGRCVDENKKD